MQKSGKCRIREAGDSRISAVFQAHAKGSWTIIKWVENPESERVLLLLGQAGTGKSSIAHEIARRFDDKCLDSYFAFFPKMRLTSSSRHLLAISPIEVLFSNAPLEGSSRISRLSVVPETIVRFLNASSLNRSRTCRFLVQFSSSSMHWMRGF
jgi:hypothetical protein